MNVVENFGGNKSFASCGIWIFLDSINKLQTKLLLNIIVHYGEYVYLKVLIGSTVLLD